MKHNSVVCFIKRVVWMCYINMMNEKLTFEIIQLANYKNFVYLNQEKRYVLELERRNFCKNYIESAITTFTRIFLPLASR